jgi:creatinine amidohydrolase
MSAQPSGMNRSRDFAALTSMQVQNLSPDAILLMSIGATEQHGPHLPVGTDTDIAVASTKAVIELCGEDLDVWVLPHLAMSLSDEHLGTPGTLSFSVSTMMSIFDDLGRSLSNLAPKKFVLINAHGGNTSLLGVVCRQLRIRHGLVTFLMHPSLPVDHGGQAAGGKEGALGIHAGHEETSLMLHLDAGIVDMSRADEDLPLWLNEYKHVGIGGPVSFGWTAHDLSASGTIGDPSAASASHGGDLFSAMVTSMAAGLAEVKKFQFPLQGKPHA